MELPEEDVTSGLSEIPLDNPALVFDSVGHKFWNGRRTLSKFSLELSGGKCIALAGASGGGKTTLVKVLLRYLNPSDGHVTANGVDITEINKKYFRKEVLSFCSSHASFVPGTVRQNIKLFAPSATDEEILTAFREIGATDLVVSPSFLDTKISNRTRLPKDMKNVINIVRSVLKPAQFYIFNRCFQHVNSEIIKRVITKLKTECKNCLFITFNPTVCKNADEVCFTENNSVVTVAPHKELLIQDAEYASFFTAILEDNENQGGENG
jgi:ABC-type multidrug transport system fused ATPase/permease subunit